MADKPKALTAEELDAMTPDQRLAAFRERLVTDPDELPEDLRQRVFETARQRSAKRSRPS